MASATSLLGDPPAWWLPCLVTPLLGEPLLGGWWPPAE